MVNQKLKNLLKKFPNAKLGIQSKLDYRATGFPTYDKILGGGEPQGVVVEHWGEPGCGKTSYRLQEAGNFLAEDKMVIWYDPEHAVCKLPPEYLKTLGVDVNNPNFIYIEPVVGSHGRDLDLILQLVREYDAGLVVIDSVAQLDSTPDRGMEKQEQASLSKYLKRFLRKMLDMLAEKNTKLVIINQITVDISKTWVSETTPGGKNPKFVTWARIRFGKPKCFDLNGNDCPPGDTAVGFKTRVVIKKTRGGRPHLETELRFDYDKGFNKKYDVLQHMIKTGAITQKGAWYYYKGKTIQGQEKLMALLEDNNDK